MKTRNGDGRRVDMPMQTRSAAIAVQTANKENRTVELVWTTGARGLRNSWDGAYYEELSLDDGHVDLNRLNSGAPLLNSHNSYGLGDVIGVVERAWIEGGEGRAVVRFSTREDVNPIWQDVENGILRNVSVGYWVRKYQVEERKGDLPVYRAIDWEPGEISIVAIPFDAGAGTRSADEVTTNPCDIIETNERAADAGAEAEKEPEEMTTPVIVTTDAVETRAAAPAVDAASIVAAERARVSAINAIVRTHNLGDDFATRHVDGGSTVEAVRAAALDALATKQEETSITRASAGVSYEDPATVRDAMAGAILARATYTAPVGAAAKYMDFRMLDMAAELAGVRSRNPDEILRRAVHTTSDFPMLLEAAANKVLLAGYAMANPSYRALSTRRDFRDFKPTKMLRAGDFPTLLEYGEDGEIQDGTISEGREQVVLSSFGRIVQVSRRLLINDDLGAFADLMSMASRRIAEFENQTFYAMKGQNSGAGPTMSDGNSVFHASHGNVAGAGGAISVATVSAGRAAMRKQKSIDGVTLNIAPSIILVGADKETEAEQFVAAVAPAQTSNVNPFSGKLSVVTDATITGNAWELYANPASAPVFMYGYLQGAAGPRFMTEQGFRTDGVALRLTLDFGCGVIDHRGGYRNAGN